MRGVAAIGNLAKDTVDGGRPRVGGAPFHAARALRLLGGNSRIVRARPRQTGACWSDRWRLSASAGTGCPRRPRRYSDIRYRGEEREMTIGDPGSPWTLADVSAVGRAEWAGRRL